MRALFLSLFLAWQLSATTTFIIDPGKITAGVYQSTVASTITVTLSGSPSSGVNKRFVVGFPMSNSNVPQIYIPVGMSGACAGGACNFINRDAPTASSCDVNNNAGSWPTDSNGRPAIKMVGCGDIDATGTIVWTTNADPNLSAQGVYQQLEGCQCIQGSYGPGPITYRNNDSAMGGNPFHLADDGGKNAIKSDIVLRRNRIRPYWGGLYHPNNPDADGNAYGNRDQQFETKGGWNVWIEGNLWGGNFNDNTQANVGEVLVVRNENQGSNNVMIKSNVFEHIAGGFLLNDLNNTFYSPTPPGSAPSSTAGPPGRNAAIVNNVMWDVNQKGPDTTGIGPLGAFNGSYPSTGSYATVAGEFLHNGQSRSGQGWLTQGPEMAEGLYIANNTFPDIRGSIPDLFFMSDSLNNGLVMKKNFLSLNTTPFTGGLGARYGGTGDASCNTRSGRALLNCAWGGASSITGNVWFAQNQTQAAINAAGWNTGNTVPASPANLTAVFPNYTVSDWHTDLDPEIYRQTVYPGVGADISELKKAMGYVDNPTAAFDPSNNLKVAWLAPDSQACTIDYAAPGQLYGTFSRSSADTGGARLRNVSIPAVNFAAHTSYDVRINCEVQQPVLHAKSN